MTTQWNVLVAEDDPVLAYCVRLSLQLNGCAVRGPYAQVADALASIDLAMPNAAVLDFRLRDGTSEPLVSKLLAQDVPVILVTGHEVDELPKSVLAARILLKPVHADVLLEEIALLCQGMPRVPAAVFDRGTSDEPRGLFGPAPPRSR